MDGMPNAAAAPQAVRAVGAAGGGPVLTHAHGGFRGPEGGRGAGGVRGPGRPADRVPADRVPAGRVRTDRVLTGGP